jgi:hypothetical protein
LFTQSHFTRPLLPAAAKPRGNNVETVDHLHAALEIPYRSSYVPFITFIGVGSRLKQRGAPLKTRSMRVELPIWMKF